MISAEAVMKTLHNSLLGSICSCEAHLYCSQSFVMAVISDCRVHFYLFGSKISLTWLNYTEKLDTGKCA